ncbi:transporter [Danxiaibacter flavus]|uniref:Transporter n=1 Tax=Danxiaibacter flavus TaxID=3049108 RepID=A0ABV3ZIY8_9BACT|nr:transporter [Chitinophagaceae bacterium DXS]
MQFRYHTKKYNGPAFMPGSDGSFLRSFIYAARIFFTCLVCFYCIAGKTQDLEPRIYANLPKNMNAVAFVYGYAKGNVVADPSLPIADFKITSHNLGVGYVRTFGIANKLSRVQLSLPYTDMAGQLKINGHDTSGARSGFSDMRVRIGMNLWGSPAMDKKDFRRYQQKTIVGVSLVTSVPIGLYYSDKRINLGSHRWAFKPEVGVSRRFKRFYTEAYAGVWLYTNNNKYLVDKVQEQRPVFSIQGHVCYYFKNQMWVGVNGNWFNGGETTVNGVAAGDLKDNWRVGAIWAVPLAKSHSIKLQLHTGAFTASGLDYNIVAISYQYIFF